MSDEETKIIKELPVLGKENLNDLLERFQNSTDVIDIATKGMRVYKEIQGYDADGFNVVEYMMEYENIKYQKGEENRLIE